MILAYVCNSNQLKESFSEDGVDSPKLVKQILILDNPYGHENSIPAVIKMRVDNFCWQYRLQPVLWEASK